MWLINILFNANLKNDEAMGCRQIISNNIFFKFYPDIFITPPEITVTISQDKSITLLVVSN